MFLKMEKIEIRAVIKYFVKKGFSAKEIEDEFRGVLGEASPSKATICRWTAEFQRGRESIGDDPRSGRPKSVTSPEIIKQISYMVLDDRRLKVREIAEAIGISTGSAYSILTENLGMKKLCARWVPHLLSSDQKANFRTMFGSISKE